MIIIIIGTFLGLERKSASNIVRGGVLQASVLSSRYHIPGIKHQQTTPDSVCGVWVHTGAFIRYCCAVALAQHFG